MRNIAIVALATYSLLLSTSCVINEPSLETLLTNQLYIVDSLFLNDINVTDKLYSNRLNFLENRVILPVFSTSQGNGAFISNQWKVVNIDGQEFLEIQDLKHELFTDVYKVKTCPTRNKNRECQIHFTSDSVQIIAHKFRIGI